jgi:two-component system phosphate regulon sensor histidine kinase PhoR
MITQVSIAISIVSLIALAFLLIIQRKNRLKSNIESSVSINRLKLEIQTANLERDRLLDALNDAFLLVDTDSNIRFANAAARLLFGNRQVVDRPLHEVFLDARLTKGVLQCLKSGEPVQDKVILPQQSSPLGDHDARGITAWVIDSARLPNPDGKYMLTRVIVRDVTASYQIEQIRKDFVANASHELRTPLAIINGYLENLMEEGATNDQDMTRRFLTIMQKHTERISRIVEDMLVISRLESGEANSLKIEPFRFRSCIQDVLERLESVIRTQNATVRIIMPDESLITQGDRFYWTQVLFNLVENALKQNPHPGLHVEVGCEATPDGHQRIWVADDGIGIPSVDLPHIFRRFYRVEKHHSQREIKGTGLGLSIVKRAVEAHGGTISVTSTPGRDTRFAIEV